ncbi:MAG: putative bifunctional diguanylate cyclase/phosphodiesterase [Wenzhouxiangella sp.]
MTTALRARPRLLAYALLWALMTVLATASLWLIWSQHQAAEAHVLERQSYVHRIGWQAIQHQHQSRAQRYLQPLLVHPILLEALAAAQTHGATGRLPAELTRRLAETGQSMHEQGFRSVRFHRPDGSLLFNAGQAAELHPEAAELPLAPLLAPESQSPLAGFKLGAKGLAQEMVFPILCADQQALGSVAMHIDKRLLLRDLKTLWPDRQFEMLIYRDALGLDGLALDQFRLSPWQGSERLLLKRLVDDSAEPAAAPAVLDPGDYRGMASWMSHPALATHLNGDVPSALRLASDGRDFVVVPTVLTDVHGAPLGLLLAASAEPAFEILDAGLRLNASVAMLIILVLGLVSQKLLRVLAEKSGERRRLGLITRSLGQGLFVLDGEGRITEVNARACELLGYEQSELLGQRASDVFQVQQGQTPSLGAAHFYGEQRFRRKDGVVLQVAVSSVPLQGEEGSVTLFDDITRQKLQEGQLKRIAHFDALTGLANRVLLAERLQTAMTRTRRSGTRLAVAFIDLDGFKAINDNHGHEMGDRLLVRLGRRMQAVVRDTDTVARLGGDEFAVVLTHIGDSTSYAPMLERLLDALAQPELIEGETLQVSGSIGVSLYPQTEEVDADQLLRQADQAMYDAKMAGKGRYRVFDAERHADLLGQSKRIERLREALDRSELRLYFQPWISLASGKTQALEALVRWHHPEKGLLSSSAFMPWVRRHELEVDIGRWSLRQALRQLDHWRRQGRNFVVSVNIGGEHLQHPHFFNELRRELNTWPDLRAQQLQLEIIESSALENVDEVCKIIGACADLGVRIALDDFGTGYSSLSYLRRLPVQTLKLHRSFISGMLEQPEDLTIVDGVLRLARAFELDVVAEGVETLEQGRMLRRMGCEMIQGQAVAHPMPPSGVLQWEADWSLPREWAGVETLAGDAREVLYGQIEHRAWMRALKQFLSAAEAEDALSPPRSCRLGRRLQSGLARRADRPTRQRLLDAYRKLQELGEELIQLRRSAGPYVAMERWAESDLERLAEELETALESLTEPGMLAGTRRTP